MYPPLKTLDESVFFTKLYASNKSYFIKEEWKEISNKINFFPNNIIQKAFLID